MLKTKLSTYASKEDENNIVVYLERSLHTTDTVICCIFSDEAIVWFDLN